MGSDYQRIKISEVVADLVVLEVTEYHPDMAAVGWLLAGEIRGVDPGTPTTVRADAIELALKSLPGAVG